MSAWQALILAIVQGVTEFLPISSSAHLILVPYFFDWQDQGLTFDIVTNSGTLLAVMVYFRRDLWALARRPFAGLGAGDGEGRAPMLGLIGVATVPVVLAGLTFYGWISTTARDPRMIAIASILSGILLWLADHAGRHRRRLGEVGFRDALLIGLAQAVALIPGTSRSGVTMTAALGLGYRREAAARFSFLLAIPVGLAALAHDLKDVIEQGVTTPGAWHLYLIGFLVSMLCAFSVIDWLLGWLRRQNLDIFAAYKVLIGGVILAFLWAA